MMEFYSVAFHEKRHIRHSSKLMTVLVEPINLDLSYGIDSEDLVITGQR